MGMANEEQRTRKGLVKKLSVLFLILIAGCMTTYKDMKSWEGHTVDELYLDMGAPDEIEELGSGYKVMTWIRKWSKDGKAHTCRRMFTVMVTGNEEKVTKTSSADCPVFTYRSR